MILILYHPYNYKTFNEGTFRNTKINVATIKDF